MALNSLGQYVAAHKVWDHVGNIIPDVEVCEGDRPFSEFKPASWLPVKFYDKYFENWLVTMPGQLVALDPDGRVMPAEYGLTSATVTYTASDISAGTIDISTGVAVTSAKTVTLSGLSGGWAGEFMGRQGVAFGDSTVKYPIGVCPYPYLQWAGDNGIYDDGSNPVGFKYNNYQMQHQVAVLCDGVIKLPIVPGQQATESLNDNATSGTLTFGTVGWHSRANTIANSRYASTGYNPCPTTATVVACALDEYPVAKNTSRTPISSTVSGMLVNEVGTIAEVRTSGDFYVDYEVGVIFVYSSNGTTIPTCSSDTITYFNYVSVPSVLSQFGCILASTAEIKPGDFLGCTTGSNWGKISLSASTIPCEIMGQIISFETFPKDYLDYVRTNFNPAINSNASGAMSNATAATSSVGLGQMDQMPGTATGGVPGDIHYTGAANIRAIVNIIGR